MNKERERIKVRGNRDRDSVGNKKSGHENITKKTWKRNYYPVYKYTKVNNLQRYCVSKKYL